VDAADNGVNAMKPTNLQILLIRLILGGLFLHLALSKYEGGWLTNPAPLQSSLEQMHKDASGAQLVYLNYVALPYPRMWSRFIILGEGFLGVSLLAGALVRLSSILGIFMVLNFHAATGTLFTWGFFGSSSAGLLITALLVVFLARAGRWVGIDALLAKSNPGGVLT